MLQRDQEGSSRIKTFGLSWICEYLTSIKELSPGEFKELCFHIWLVDVVSFWILKDFINLKTQTFQFSTYTVVEASFSLKIQILF